MVLAVGEKVEHAEAEKAAGVAAEMAAAVDETVEHAVDEMAAVLPAAVGVEDAVVTTKIDSQPVRT